MKTAAGEERPRTLWLPVGFSACVALLIFWAVVSARRADFQHRLCLDAFTPMIQGVVALGAGFEQNVIPRLARVGQTISALLVLLSAVGLVWRRGKGLKPALLLFALAFAVYGQCLLLQREIPGGIRLYGAALLFVVVAELLPKRFGSFASQKTGGAPSTLEFVALAFVTAVALLYRFYALNQLPNDFEGEAAYFMACATSFRSAALVNAGVANGPWSPFGWLYYIPVYLVTKLFGSHLLSIRFVSALAGVVSVPLLWALLRRLAGPVEALFGSVLLCFGLTEMFWSRTDVFPYNAPGVIGIALAWCTYEAIARERLGYFVLAAVLMAVSFHQFPSGQTLFLIPVGAVGVHALLERGFFKRCWKKALILILGAALWYSGHSLNILLATGQLKKASPFALNPGKTLWSLPVESPDLLRRVESLARKVEQNAADVVRSKFVEIVFGPHPHHEGIPGLQGIATREISAAAAILVALSLPLLLLRLKTPASQVVLVWIIAALLPGLLSTSASAHRTATVFPASFAAAALAGGDVIRAIRKLLGNVGTIVVAMGGGTLFAGLAVVAARLYLETASSATPPTVVMADAIRPYFAEGTLAVLDIDGGDYLGSELTYLFIDDLSRGSRPPLWRISRGSDWPEIAFHPRPGYDDWYYTYTRLRNRRDAFMGEPPPKRVVFLVQDTPERRSHVELLSELYPRVAAQRHVFSESPRQYNFVAFVVERASLYEAMSPLVQGGNTVSNPNGPAAWWEGREVRAVNAAPSTTITVSAGVWIPRQRWSRFRVPGAGEGSRVLLDGTLLDERAVRPITRGVHRIEIQLGKSPRLPLYLEEAAETEDYRRFPPESVLAPELATRSAFAPETVVPYPGYDPPMPLTALERAFFADLTVSPSGELGSLWAYENR
ncbi:MAG TPA: glycosyltransferase family 39 protein, partial [Thermoanaerobaculia bacterium]